MRWLRALRMVLTIAAAAVVVLFAASFVWAFSFYGERVCWATARGVVLRLNSGARFTSGSPLEFQVASAQSGHEVINVYNFDWANDQERTSRPWMLPRWGNGPGYVSRSWIPPVMVVPLWLPFLIVAVPCAVLWRFVPPRRPPGHCQRCNYDMRSLAVGTKCPECGSAVIVAAGSTIPPQASAPADPPSQVS